MTEDAVVPEDSAAFGTEETDLFYEALDSLPNFDSETASDQYEIEEEDWQWLASAVGSRTVSQTVQFAQGELEKLTSDPELVRALHRISRILTPAVC